jgi:hypothetical protein
VLGVDVKKILVVLIAILFISSIATAFPIQVDNQIDVFKEASFNVEITNSSNAQENLVVNFFAPTDVTIFAPKTIPPNQTVTAKIIVRDSFDKYTEIDSKLEVFVGSALEERQVLLKFYESQDAFVGATGSFAALFTLPFAIETNFTTIEWVAFFILVLIVLALLIAFIARLAKRI